MHLNLGRVLQLLRCAHLNFRHALPFQSVKCAHLNLGRVWQIVKCAHLNFRHAQPFLSFVVHASQSMKCVHVNLGCVWQLVKCATSGSMVTRQDPHGLKVMHASGQTCLEDDASGHAVRLKGDMSGRTVMMVSYTCHRCPRCCPPS